MVGSLTSSEWRLLLSCSKIIPDLQKIKEPSTQNLVQLDENLLIKWVDRHRIAPLAYLSLMDSALVSGNFKSLLKTRLEVNQLDALRTKKFMVLFHDFMTSKGFRFLFLKGLTVAEIYYGDPGLRSSIDVDVWVEPDAFDSAVSWVKSIGYLNEWEILGWNKKQISHLLKVDHGMGFVAGNNDLPQLLELHTRITSSIGGYYYDPLTPMQKLLQLNIASRIFPVMNHEDQFLYLCVHGAEHAWFRLKWVFDLPKILDRFQFDWDAMRKKSIEMCCLAHLEIAFLVMHHLLGYEIPRPIGEQLNRKKYTALLQHIFESIADEKGINDSDRSRMSHLFYSMRLAGGIPNFPFFLHYLTGPGDWKLIRLPERLFFLYYLLRPALWIYRRLRSVFVKPKL